ncbi:MAG: carotenoid oxygenase family protein, partial [Burkholderiaceae bacterium]
MSSVLEPLAWDAPDPGATDRRRGFRSGAREIDAAPVRVDGHLPDWLRGRLLLNGPALWELPNGHFEHWFDGLAMLHRLRIGPDGVEYRSRFARSQSYTQAMASGVPATAEFDTPSPASLWTRLKGAPVTDNPAVVMSRVGSSWIAVTETPTLTRFDPDTLETTGPLPVADDLRIHLMAAHGFTDDAGSYWNVGTRLGPTCEVMLFRLQPGSTRRDVVASLRLRKAGYTHGFAMTARHAIVWETAMRAQALSFRFSARSYIRNFRWEPASGSRLHAISRVDGSVRSWDAPPMMCFHAIQAWEEGKSFVVELITYADATILEDLRLAPLRQGQAQRCVPKLMRYRLEPGHREAEVESFGDAFELPQ